MPNPLFGLAKPGVWWGIVGAVEARTERREPFLLGPWVDLVFGCGLGYLGLAALVHLIGRLFGLGMEQIGGFLPFLVLFTGIPHYGATLLRVYASKEARRKYALYAFGFGALVWGVFLGSFSFSRLGAFFITLYLTWSPYHYTRQNFGLVMMFLRRAGLVPSVWLRQCIHGSFLASFFLVFVNIHGAAGSGGRDPLYSADDVYRFVPLGIPERVTHVLLLALAALYLSTTLGSAIHVGRQKQKTLPALLLVLSQGLWFVVPIVLGRAFPGLYGAKGPAALAFIWVAIAHSVQYLWISVHYARASGTIPKTTRATIGYLWIAVLAGAAIWFVPAFLFAPGFFADLPFESGLGLLVAAAVNIHHFILDGAIWKLRDPSVGRALLSEEKNNTVLSLALPARLALFVFGGLSAFAWCFAAYEKEMGEKRALAQGDLGRLTEAAHRLVWVGRDGPKIHASLGRLLKNRGELGRAKAEFEKSLVLRKNPAAWVGIGTVAEAEHHEEQAKEAYRAALALDPRHVSALDHLATLLAKQGDFKQALELRYQATLAAPDKPDLRVKYEALRKAITEPSDDALGEEIVVGGD